MLAEFLVNENLKPVGLTNFLRNGWVVGPFLSIAVIFAPLSFFFRRKAINTKLMVGGAKL